jgi:hypothetical protein
LDQPRVGRYRVSFFDQDDVADDETGRRDALADAASNDMGMCRRHPAQRGHGLLCASLLEVAHQRIQKEAVQVQADRLVDDPWAETIANYVNVVSGNDVSIEELLKVALDMKTERWSQVELNRVARVLRALGFERYQIRCGDKRQWRYRRHG